jgi:hypothetical protein
MCPVHETSTTFFNYSILEVTAQVTTLHSYILEQLVFAAPREWIYLCLSHGIDWPSFPCSRVMLPPLAPGLAWLHGLGSSSFCYQQLVRSGCSINHTYKFSYNYYMKLKSFHICLALWTHDTLHIHIQITAFLHVLPCGY